MKIQIGHMEGAGFFDTTTKSVMSALSLDEELIAEVLRSAAPYIP